MGNDVNIFRHGIPIFPNSSSRGNSFRLRAKSELSNVFDQSLLGDGITQGNTFFVRPKYAMLEAARTGGAGPIWQCPSPPRQAFTHGAGTPDSHQYSGWVLGKSASIS
jgi:hypothetical protein